MDFLALIPAFGGLIWTILAFIVALSIIVAIHEYGHYIVGRWSGIKADVFSIGFGPILWSRMDKRGTRWQIAALPFGGYVKFAGDANAASGKDEEAMQAAAGDPQALRSTMHGAPLWARSATVAAGPVFNFALSLVVFAAVFLATGVQKDPLTVGELRPMPASEQQLLPGDIVLEVAGTPFPDLDTDDYSKFLDTLPSEPLLTYVVERDGGRAEVTGPHFQPPVIESVGPQTAAMDAGLKAGDVIVSVDGEDIYAFQQLKERVEGSDGVALELGVWRDGTVLTKSLQPKRVDEPQPDGGFKTHWRIGIVGGNAFEPARTTPGFVEAVSAGAAQTWRIITGSISGLTHMISGAISTCNLSGPIGIAQTSGAMASQGAQSFVWFVAVLSTAVGLLNLFPIPALDGGHLVFYAYEAVTGKPPSDAALRFLMAIGLSLVLTLMLFALYNDIVCP